MKFLITQYLLVSYCFLLLGPRYLPQGPVIENLLYIFRVIFLYIGSPVWKGDTVHVHRRLAYVFPLHLLAADFQFLEVLF
jgi:hypothetical protein